MLSGEGLRAFLPRVWPTAEYITGEIAKGGKPVVGFSIEDQGGTVEVAYRAAQAAIQMLHDAGRLRPEPMPWSEFVLGVECGGSDGSSGIVSNPVTGRLADRVIDAGGTVIMSETLELLGGEAPSTMPLSTISTSWVPTPLPTTLPAA